MVNWLIWNQSSFSSLPSFFDPVGFLLEPTGHQKLVIMVAMMAATTMPVDAGTAAPAPEATDPGSRVPGAAPVGAGLEPAEGAAGASRERASIRIATYNIRSGHAGRLEMALRAMNQMNVDIGILMETKLTDGIHTRQSSGYHVYATSARSHSQGGVVLFFRNSALWQVESIRCFGPNVISCQLVMSQCRIPVMGAYIPWQMSPHWSLSGKPWTAYRNSASRCASVTLT
jgi:hypothetical protein